MSWRSPTHCINGGWERSSFWMVLNPFFEKKGPPKKYAVHIISTLVSWERSFGWFLTQEKAKVASGLTVGSRFTSENLPRWSKRSQTYLIKAFQSTTAFAASHITSLHSFIRWHKLPETCSWSSNMLGARTRQPEKCVPKFLMIPLANVTKAQSTLPTGDPTLKYHELALWIDWCSTKSFWWWYVMM